MEHLYKWLGEAVQPLYCFGRYHHVGGSFSPGESWLQNKKVKSRLFSTELASSLKRTRTYANEILSRRNSVDSEMNKKEMFSHRPPIQLLSKPWFTLLLNHNVAAI